MADLDSERMRILEMIENGKISASDGLKLLNALNESEEPDEESPEQPAPPTPAALTENPPTPEAPEIPAAEGERGILFSGEGEGPPTPHVPPVLPTSPTPPLLADEPEGLDELEELDELDELPDEELAELEELDEAQEPEESEIPESSEGARETASAWSEPSEGSNGRTAYTAYEAQPESENPASAYAQDKSIRRWRSFWQIPLWIGLGITLIGGLWMYQAYRASGVGFWFACAWFPFLIGVALMAFAWASRSMRWLHVRIHQKPGERPQTIAISLPLPLRFSAWAVRTFGHRIPNIEGKGLDEMILAMQHTSPETPFFVDVDEGDGEHVQIFIG